MCKQIKCDHFSRKRLVLRRAWSYFSTIIREEVDLRNRKNYPDSYWYNKVVNKGLKLYEIIISIK